MEGNTGTFFRGVWQKEAPEWTESDLDDTLSFSGEDVIYYEADDDTRMGINYEELVKQLKCLSRQNGSRLHYSI